MEFEWDEGKQIRNFAKHGIDFRRAIHVFDGFTVTHPSGRAGEQRFITVGEVDDCIIAVIYTNREYPGTTKRRIISARVARTYERAQYRAAQYG